MKNDEREEGRGGGQQNERRGEQEYIKKKAIELFSKLSLHYH